MKIRSALVCAALLLASCTKVDTSPAGTSTTEANAFTHPHVLRFADIGDISTLNPMLSTFAPVGWIGQLTAAWLVRYDRNNQPSPELTTDIPTQANGGISKDGLTITYHLRHGVKWSDGAPFDGDDVVFTVGKILDPKTNVVGRDGWDLISKVDEPDKFTIVFHLKKRYSSFVTTFFSTGGANPCILPKHILLHTRDINTDPYNTKPIGIGPFRVTEWRRGDRVIMEANPNYWRGLPKLTRVEYRIVPNRDTLFTQLQTGDVDLWPLAPRSYKERYATLKGYTMAPVVGYGYGHIDFNLTRPVLHDRAVREALRFAVDRETLNTKIGRGLGVVQDGFKSPASPFFDISIAKVPFDLAKASALLDAAGWKRGADGIRAKNGLRLTITFVSNTGAPDTDRAIELIRSWWKQIGVETLRKTYDPVLLFDTYQNGGIFYTGKFDAILLQWLGQPGADSSTIYGCDQFPPNGQNSMHWCNLKAQAAMNDIKTSYDLERQKRDINIVQEQLVADVPSIVTAISDDIFVYNNDLKGFGPNQVSIFDTMMDVDI